MAKFRVYVFKSATGATVVQDQLAQFEKIHPKGFDSFRTGLERLEEVGPDSGLNRFTRLRHTGGEELWELKVTVRPAYRILFAPVPGEDAFVILHVVAKSQMAANSQRQIDRALENLQHWLDEVFLRGER